VDEYGQLYETINGVMCSTSASVPMLKIYGMNSLTRLDSEVLTLIAGSTSVAACMIKVLWIAVTAVTLTEPSTMSMDMAQPMEPRETGAPGISTVTSLL